MSNPSNPTNQRSVPNSGHSNNTVNLAQLRLESNLSRLTPFHGRKAHHAQNYHQETVQDAYDRLVGTPRVKDMRAELRVHQGRSDTFLGFTTTVGVFAASVGVSLLSFTNDRIGARGAGAPKKATDEVIFALLYMSVALSLFVACMSCISHSGVIATFSPSTNRRYARDDEEQRCRILVNAIDEERSAVHGIFWFATVMIPAIACMLTGMTILAWSEHNIVAAIPLTVSIAYGLIQTLRVILTLF